MSQSHREIAKQLVSHSSRLEIGRKSDMSVTESLGLLGLLEKTTSDCLKPQLIVLALQEKKREAELASLSPVTSPAPALSHAHPQPLNYGTDKREYQPALQDPALINALLNLRKSTPSKTQSAPVQRTVARDASKFKANPPPVVQAAPKPQIKLGTGVRTGTSILRLQNK